MKGATLLTLMFMSQISLLLCQPVLKIVDRYHKGIPNCQVLSRNNHVMMVTNDSGLVNMDMVKLNDTLVIMHLAYREQEFYYTRSPYRIIMLVADTLLFDKVTVNSFRCHWDQLSKTRNYGEGPARKRIEGGMSVMQLGCVKTARRFNLQSRCTRLEKVNLYIPDTKKYMPNYNAALLSKYRIGFFMVRDSIIHDSSRFYMITPLYDLKKLKKGWNSFMIDSCFVNGRHLIIGFGLVLKEGEIDHESKNATDNIYSFESPLFVKSISADSVYYYQVACYGQTVWYKHPGELMLNIETREE